MKISKSILEAALGLFSQKIAPHSPKGNYVTVNESKEAEGHLWQAGEHKKAAEKHEPNSKQWHAAMAAHHESKAEYYHHKGVPTLSDKHAGKAEAHLMKMHESVEIDESLMEEAVTVVHKGEGGHHRITVGKTAEGKTFVSSKFDTSGDPKKPSGHGSSQSLANYVHSKHGDGTAEKSTKLHSALVAAHATGDKKKVLAAVKAHGYSHHDWKLNEEVLDEAMTSHQADKKAFRRSENDDDGHVSAVKYSKPKHFHEVPYKDKEHAKGEGMRWDNDKRKWYHTDAGKSATSKFRKLTEEESLDEGTLEEAVITVRDNLGDKASLTGKKVGTNKEHGFTIHAGSAHHHRTGNSGPRHNVWVMHGEKLIASHATHDEAEHKKAISHAKTATHFWSDKEKHKSFNLHNHDKPTVVKEEELAEAQSLESLRKMHQSERENGGGTDASWAKMYAIRALVKKYHGKAAHDKMVKDTDDYAAHGGSGPARLKEEEKKKVRFDHRDAATAGVMHSDDAPRMKPNMQHDFYSSKNGDKIQGTVHTVTKDRVVIQANKEYHKDHGKFHTFKFAKSYDRMNEEDESLDVMIEEHATREQAEKRMSEIEKKHPMAKHTVMQGRRSGKWHVVRHTSGGMHVIESIIDEDCGLESKADFNSKKTTFLDPKDPKTFSTGAKHLANIVKSTVKPKKETK